MAKRQALGYRRAAKEATWKAERTEPRPPNRHPSPPTRLAVKLHSGTYNHPAEAAQALVQAIPSVRQIELPAAGLVATQDLAAPPDAEGRKAWRLAHQESAGAARE